MAAQTTQLGFNVTPPTKDGFGGAPWKADANLAILAERVMSKYPERFTVARNFSIEYLWRANGGTTRGEPKFADCVKLGGLAYHFSSADFVIWFAADHLSDFGFKDRDYEALMFRQLMHIGSNENTSSAVLVGFDFKGFNAELAAYGPWDEALKKMSQTLQPTLFDAPAAVADGERRAAEGVALIEDYRQSLAEEAATESAAEASEDLPPAEVQPTEDLSSAAMADAGWTLDPAPNGRPHSEADEEAEQAFAASRRRK
jgi:hypothetical protein